VAAADAPATVDPKGAFSQEERFAVPGGTLRVKVEVKDVSRDVRGFWRGRSRSPRSRSFRCR